MTECLISHSRTAAASEPIISPSRPCITIKASRLAHGICSRRRHSWYLSYSHISDNWYLSLSQQKNWYLSLLSPRSDFWYGLSPRTVFVSSRTRVFLFIYFLILVKTEALVWESKVKVVEEIGFTHYWEGEWGTWKVGFGAFDFDWFIFAECRQ